MHVPYIMWARLLARNIFEGALKVASFLAAAIEFDLLCLLVETLRTYIPVYPRGNRDKKYSSCINWQCKLVCDANRYKWNCKQAKLK
jgi:hypothetical protein